MVYKIIFSFLFLLNCNSISASYDTNINYNDVNVSYIEVISWSWSNDIIEQKIWYYTIIDSIIVSNDCNIINCWNWQQLYWLYDWTGIIYTNNSINQDSTYIIPINSIIKHNFNIINSSPEVTIIMNINYHYVLYDNTFFWKIMYYTKYNTTILDEVLSYIIIYFIYIFLFIFFAKKWYKTGADYFIKKRND
jgi:hypothetical protein